MTSATSKVRMFGTPRGTVRDNWLGYLGRRSGNYHFRTRRYAAACAALERLGLADGQLIYDVGAGMCEFGKYLYGSGWTGRYMPVDGAIDGIDLNIWQPQLGAEFIVALEVVEHLERPDFFLRVIETFAYMGAVITTPNPAVVDVLALDETHVHPIERDMLERRGWSVEPMDLFGTAEDSLLATYKARG